jgi:hypothetical protein
MPDREGPCPVSGILGRWAAHVHPTFVGSRVSGTSPSATRGRVQAPPNPAPAPATARPSSSSSVSSAHGSLLGLSRPCRLRWGGRTIPTIARAGPQELPAGAGGMARDCEYRDLAKKRVPARADIGKQPRIVGATMLGVTSDHSGRSASAAARIRLVDRVVFAIAAAVLSSAGCVSGSALCAGAGGTYAGGACIRSSPSRSAVEEQCAAMGGVYLGGEERCVVSAGGA